MMIDLCPIFILGNRRSGTTLLRLMLTNHSNVCIPPEGGFIYLLGWRYGYRKSISNSEISTILNLLFSMNNTQDWGFERSRLAMWLKQILPCDFPSLIDSLYRFYMQENFPQKSQWGDKTTGYLDHIHELKTYFPKAKYLHIVRDVRAVVASYRKVPHLPNQIEPVVMEWLNSEAHIRQLAKQVGSGQYKMIRYEDLIGSPEAILMEICEFLDLPYEARMMDYWLANRERELEPSRHLGWKQLTLEKVTTKRLCAWKDELNLQEQERIITLARRELCQKGYLTECKARPPLSFRLKFLFNKAYRRTRTKLRIWKYRFIVP